MFGPAHYYCNRGNTLEESGKVEAAIGATGGDHVSCRYPDAHSLGIALKTGVRGRSNKEYRRTIEIKPTTPTPTTIWDCAEETNGREAILAYEQAILITRTIPRRTAIC